MGWGGGWHTVGMVPIHLGVPLQYLEEANDPTWVWRVVVSFSDCLLSFTACDVEKRKLEELEARLKLTVFLSETCILDLLELGYLQCLEFLAALILFFNIGSVNAFDISKNAFVELHSINFLKTSRYYLCVMMTMCVWLYPVISLGYPAFGSWPSWQC